jgi:hypothetical protein
MFRNIAVAFDDDLKRNPAVVEIRSAVMTATFMNT